MAEIIGTVNQYPEGIAPRDLASIVQMDDAQIRKYLRRANAGGRIANPKRGVYAPVTSVTSVTFSNPKVT